MSEVYPWLEPSFRYLLRLQIKNRLPHAILCTGQGGLGLETLALNWARRLLCHNQGDCGSCASCALFAAGNHPDFLWIQSEEQRAIAVDEIRGLIDFVAQTPGHSKNKIILISDAEKMSTSAANALLKALEEPPPSSKMVLVSAAPHRLPATVRSRCHFLRVYPPKKEISLPWLIHETNLPKESCMDALLLTQHLPLKALAWLKENKTAQKNKFLEGLLEVGLGQRNPIEFSDSLTQGSFPELMDWLYHCVLDIVRLCSMEEPLLYHHDKVELLWKLKKCTTGNIFVLTKYLDRLVQLKRKFQEGIRFNEALLWDRIMAEWCLLLPQHSCAPSP